MQAYFLVIQSWWLSQTRYHLCKTRGEATAVADQWMKDAEHESPFIGCKPTWSRWRERQRWTCGDRKTSIQIVKLLLDQDTTEEP